METVILQPLGYLSRANPGLHGNPPTIGLIALLALKFDHLDYVFDLLEKMLDALDFTPLVPGTEAQKLYKVKGLLMAPKGGGEMGKYQSTLPATEEDIRKWDYLKYRLDRLTLFTQAKVTINEYRPREYFGDLPDLAEKEGYEPMFYDVIKESRSRRREEKTTSEE